MVAAKPANSGAGAGAGVGVGPRIAAVRTLVQVIQHGRSLDAVRDEAPPPPDGRDESLRRELCYGTLRYGPRLQRVLDRLLDHPLKARDTDVRAILLTGLYQLLYLRTPDHAAVSASVDAAGQLGKRWARGLVNAVLRRFLREQVEIIRVIDAAAEGRYAHPDWLIEMIRRAWPQDWTNILAANDARAPMTLRVNARKVDRDTYRDHLRSRGLDTELVEGAPQALNLVRPCAIEALPGFEEGAVSVQDAAAQLAANLLDVSPSSRVLDACAAPGGKTAHLLEVGSNPPSVTAIDADRARADRVDSTLARLGLQAESLHADIRHPESWWDGTAFDRILLDAPCTATGVIRRHPDIKWLRRRSDVESMARRQLELMSSAWGVLAADGVLLYATCSVLPQENDEVIGAHLATHPDACSRTIKATWGRATAHGRQILPGEHGMDGFYYALVAKR